MCSVPKQTVAIIKSGSNDRNRHHLGCVQSDQQPGVSQCTSAERAGQNDVADTLVERQRTVNSHVEQPHRFIELY